MTRRDLFRQVASTLAVLAVPVSMRTQVWYGTLGQWMHHSTHGVKRLERLKQLVEVPGGAFSNIPSRFVPYHRVDATGRYTWADGVKSSKWAGHYETAHARILGWMDNSGRVWWAKQP